MGREWGLTAAVAAAALLTGCTTTVAGTALAPSSTAPTLDTGNYPTTPRTVVAKTDADAWYQEGWKVADAVVSPREIDPEIATTAAGSVPIVNVEHFRTRNGECIFTKQQVADLGPNQLQTGFLARATSADNQKGLTLGLLRFADDAEAQRAVKVLSGPTATGTCGTKSTRVEVATAGAGMVAVAAVFTEGTTKPDVATQQRLTAAAIQAQVKNLPVYAPTPLRPGETRPAVQMDLDGIVSRTLKAAGTSTSGLSDELGFSGGWMSPHALTMSMGEIGALDGMQLVGRTTLTTTMRFKDEAAADAAKTVLLGRSPNAVAGVPAENVGCVTRDQSTSCVALMGRYLTFVGQPSESQSRQAISAMYLILKAAGK